MTQPILAHTHSSVTFGGILKAEAIKVRTTATIRGFLVAILAAQVGLTFLHVVLVAQLSSKAPIPSVYEGLGQTAIDLALMLCAVVGGLVAAVDFGCGVINLSVLAAGSRSKVAFAKAIVTAVMVSVTTFLGALGALLVGSGATAVLTSLPTSPLTDGQEWLCLVGVPLACTFSALIGLGIGLAVRSTLITTVLALSLFTIVTLILTLLSVGLGSSAGSWLYALSPSTLLQQVGILATRESINDELVFASWWVNTALALAWAALALTAGWFTFLKRPLGAGAR